MSTRTDVGISFVMSSVSSNRNKREAQYTSRFPRAFAIPLNDDEEESEGTTTEPGGAFGKKIILISIKAQEILGKIV